MASCYAHRQPSRRTALDDDNEKEVFELIQHCCCVRGLTVLSWSFDLLFQSSGITSYAAVDDGSAIRADLSAMSVAMWLRTSDRLNQGTPLSYAVAEQDNELALTDCNGFVVYAAGEGKVTDVSVADGRWHHVAVTWQSRDGVWNIYEDGRREDGGRGLATGRLIRGSPSRVFSFLYHLWMLTVSVGTR